MLISYVACAITPLMDCRFPLILITLVCLLVCSACRHAGERAVEAIRRGDMETLQAIVENEPEWKEYGVGTGWQSWQRPVFQIACEQSHVQAVEILLEHGAPILHLGENGSPVCFFDVLLYDEPQDVELLELLFRRGVKLKPTPKVTHTPLYTANTIEEADWLMAHGAAPGEAVVNVFDSKVQCYLIDCIGFDNMPPELLQALVCKVMGDDKEDVFAHLLDAGLPPDYKVQGKTLLEYASERVPFESAEFERCRRCREVLEQHMKKI